MYFLFFDIYFIFSCFILIINLLSLFSCTTPRHTPGGPVCPGLRQPPAVSETDLHIPRSLEARHPQVFEEQQLGRGGHHLPALSVSVPVAVALDGPAVSGRVLHGRLPAAALA